MLKTKKGIICNTLAIIMSVVILSSTILGNITQAKAGLYDQLGTNAALGSPILNSNFTVEDWNKWEMICWGIYLSNFCVPLVDSYKTAFSTTDSSAKPTAATGSNGSGYKALCFGSGNDSENNKTIKDLTSYAIVNQAQHSNTVYVTYSFLNYSGSEYTMIDIGDPNSCGGGGFIRPATFQDLHMQIDSDYMELTNAIGVYTAGVATNPAGMGVITLLASGAKAAQAITHSSGGLGFTSSASSLGANISFFSECETRKFSEKTEDEIRTYLSNEVAKIKPVYTPNRLDSSYSDEHEIEGCVGFIPTFWIKSGEKYVKVFDYTDPWDMQIFAAISSKGTYNEDLAEIYCSNFKSYYEGNAAIKFDCFGNLVTSDNKIIVPASANQHLTMDGKINLINSLVMNGPAENLSKDTILTSARQHINEGILHIGQDLTGGVPALSGYNSKLPDGACFLYYDLDTVEADLLAGSFGTTVNEFFLNSDIESNDQKYNLKIEVVNKMRDNLLLYKSMSSYNKEGSVDKLVANRVAQHQVAASTFSTVYNDARKSEMLTEITTPSGEKLKLFDTNSSILIPVAIRSDGSKEATNTRKLWNFLYQCYMGRISTTSLQLAPSAMKDKFSRITTGESLGADFVDEYGIWDTYKEYAGIKKGKYNAAQNEAFGDWCDNNSFSDDASRLVILYPYSDTMRAISNILALQDGSEFSVYCTYIYATYLEWYGINMKKSAFSNDQESISEFNPDIFPESGDILNVDPADLIDAKTPEELDSEIKNMTYMMLSPEYGREYRSQMVTSGFADWVYHSYKKLVFGTSEGSVVSTNNNSGFLAISTFEDNFLTGFFIKNYSKIAVPLIMIMFVVMIICGLISSKKFSWYIMTSIIIINVILVTPSMGEIVPYISSNLVEKMFSSKMTFWSLSESIANSGLERDAATGKGMLMGMPIEDAKQVATLVKSLNTLNLDRSLMLKKDISAKTTQKVEGVYTEIQTLRSARWLLPMVMRQYSQEEGKADYVYTQLGDLYDDLSNMYWYFNPADAKKTHTLSPTLTSGQSTITEEEMEQLENGTILGDTLSGATYMSEEVRAKDYYELISSYYNDYIHLEEFDDDSNINYQSISYDIHGSDNPSKMVYRYGYINRLVNIPGRIAYFKDGADDTSRGYVLSDRDPVFKDADSFEGYIDYYLYADTSLIGNMVNLANKLESIAGEYNRGDRSTMEHEYMYLWTTETPAHYFYGLVKSSIPDDASLATVIGDIQGSYEPNKNGEEVRTNYNIIPKNGLRVKSYESMFFANEKVTEDGAQVIYPSGYIRDVLDLQNMFYNLVPYMYQIQLLAGGTNGEEGALVDRETGEPLMIEQFDLYEGQYKSWMFRCNWVVKLIESPEYNKEMTVRDADGNKYTVKHPMLQEYYPAHRPMIFSEAQMHAYGLSEADLNIVELKCLEANRQIVDRWTLLLNYASTPGMTLEVLERQMALEAMLVFNQVFSPSGIFSTTYAMYPYNVDLRNISFDSVMKMLMLNASRDTSYIYGDTMITLIENSDMITAVILLITTFLCSIIIPFFRTVLMALIFYMGYVAVIKSITASNKFKLKITMGQFCCNLLFLFFTCVYYLFFSLMINVTSADEVLTKSSIGMSAGNPLWVLILVLIASIVYMVLILWEIDFCFKHYRDMGFEIMHAVMKDSVGKLKKSIKSGARDLKTRMQGNKDVKSTGEDSPDSGKKKKKSKVSDETSSSETVTTSTVVQITDSLEYDSKTHSYSKKESITNALSKDYTTSSDDKITKSIESAIKSGGTKKDDKTDKGTSIATGGNKDTGDTTVNVKM